MYKVGKYRVLEPPFPDLAGLPGICCLALVYAGEGEEVDLLIGSAAVLAENRQRHRVWFKTWASFLNDDTVSWSDKLRCLDHIEQEKQTAYERRCGLCNATEGGAGMAEAA